jgi:PAS domain S-box-containing protein
LRAARVLALAAALVGLLVVTGGWMLNFSILRSIIPGAASMKVNTALCVMVAASAILLHNGKSSLARYLTPIGAGLLILISLLTLLEDLSGRNFGIDQLFVADRTAPVLVTAPGRMAVTTAVSYLLFGCALFARNRLKGALWSQVPVSVVAVLCISNLVGYFYGIDNFAGIAFYTGMAVHTSSCLLILSLAMLLSRPDDGLAALALGDGLGSVLIRRLLPAAVGVPVFLGWLTWQGELKGLYGTAFGLAIFVTANVIVFVALTWTSGLWLNRMESEKTQAEGAFRLAVEAAPSAMVMANEKGRIVLVNAQTERLFGYRREELLGRAIEILIPPAVNKVHRALRERYLSGPKMRAMGSGLELRGLRKDGSEFPVEVGLNPIRSPRGTLVLSSIVDVTDRRRVEQLQEDMQRERERLAATRGEERFRLSFEEAPVGMALISVDGVWLRVNRALCELTGYTETELIDLNHGITHPDDMAETLRSLPLFRSGQLSSWRVEKRYVHKDGHTIDVVLNVSVVEKDDAGRPLLFVAHMVDLTERKQAERELEANRAQMVSNARLSALGMLAGGIAHEINNPLAVIHASAANLTRMAESGLVDIPSLIRNCGRIEQTAERIAKIVGSLRQIAREEKKDNFSAASVCRIVEETLELCSERFRVHDIRILAPSVDPSLVIGCREGQICQVLLNLLQNAFDAVVDCEGDRWVGLDVSVQIPWVVFSITDSGPGVALENRERIMEPFFTTKPPGKGTGLGLSISKGIASDHGGRLELARDTGHTCFRLSLPLPAGAAIMERRMN